MRACLPFRLEFTCKRTLASSVASTSLPKTKKKREIHEHKKVLAVASKCQQPGCLADRDSTPLGSVLPHWGVSFPYEKGQFGWNLAETVIHLGCVLL